MFSAVKDTLLKIVSPSNTVKKESIFIRKTDCDKYQKTTEDSQESSSAVVALFVDDSSKIDLEPEDRSILRKLSKFAYSLEASTINNYEQVRNFVKTFVTQLPEIMAYIKDKNMTIVQFYNALFPTGFCSFCSHSTSDLSNY